LLTLGCGISTIRIAPPLNISRTEIDEGLIIFEQAITLAEREMMITYAS
jgi:4-aminobutyrate aminotransferase-like enzyme